MKPAVGWQKSRKHRSFVCARAGKLHIRLGLDSSGHQDWPVKPTNQTRFANER
jgi:hypothetical protein